jgi:hypothetical protein
MDEKKLSELIMEKIHEWKESQKGQTDGYEYERSFDGMMRSIGKEILQESVGQLPKNRKEKKPLKRP